MNLEALRGELRQRVRPAYLLAGDEPLLRDEARAVIRDAVLPESARDFNLDRLDGESASPGKLLDALRTLPVLSARRLVELREPEARRASARGLGVAIAEAVSELSEQGSTVLVVSASRIDRRSAWVKAFREPAVRVECDAPTRTAELMAFAQEEAKRQGLTLETGVAELLVERVGPHLLALRQELAKAALAAGDGGRISRAQLCELTSDLGEDPVWTLTDAVGEGRAGDALSALGGLLQGGAPAPVLLGALASHFRRLVRVRSGGGVSAPPFVRKKLEHQAGRYSERRMSDSLRAIHETDEALKGAGALPPDLALERLVLALAS
ncbi:MAG: DNA polymerase III subunit delta [Myxococcota bacterium]